MVRSTNVTTASLESQLKRSKFRKLLLENLDKRYLMATDAAGPIFAQGTPQAYVDLWIRQMSGGNSGGNEANITGRRWTDPVGGNSPNIGDPATITWSIVPDGTSIPQFGGGGAQPSDLIAFMDNIYGGGSGPVANRPWFQIIERAYQRWADISGVNLVYEPNDDGAPSELNNRGVLGVRGDIRVAGRPIDGNGGILAFNYFPNDGGNDGVDGDLVIDTTDSSYRTNAESAGSENRFLTNVVAHEAGHGLGLGHVIPVDQTKLMEPIVSLAFVGPQHDDILGVQTLYGDNAEQDDSLGNAVDLGPLSNGVFPIQGRSIDLANDTDFYKFTLSKPAKISVSLTPVGFTYNVAAEFGTPSAVNTLRNKDLSFAILRSDGTVLTTVNAAGLGAGEQLVDFDLATADTYVLQVLGTGTDTQLYNFSLRIVETSSNDPSQRAPRLLSVASNTGENFRYNETNQLTQSPRELTFRFDGSQVIDAATFSGIKITRSSDGIFGNSDDANVQPEFMGYGDNQRIVIARFADPLPDDLYRIEVLGVDLTSEGRQGIRNSEGVLLRPRRTGTDRDTFFMNLELGAKVVAVVPQPVVRNSAGTLDPQRNVIEVYFNDDDLGVTATDPNFYKLILTRDSVNPNDDLVTLPSTVTYDPVQNKATLTFPTNIDEIGGVSGGTFRLRVGSSEQVANASNPSTPTLLNPATDVGDTFVGSSDLGTFAVATSSVITQAIRMPGTAVLPDYPGGTHEPGKRDIDVSEQTSLDLVTPLIEPIDGKRDQNATSLADNSADIKVWRYSFALGVPYGVDSSGRSLTSIISPDQMARVREIFDFYSAQLGVDFVETTATGFANVDFTIVVGDMAPNGQTSGIGGLLAVTSNGLTIMDQAETWDNGLGNGSNIPGTQSFFLAAMHQIGHQLGLGNAYEQPKGTIMAGYETSGDEFLDVDEWFFPGNVDIAHGKYIYRPDNKDVDIYKFTVPAGVSGKLALETVAERLNNASNVDTHLTLMRKTGSTFEVVALNDNYFSEDSRIQVDVSGGVAGTEYFIAVTARGNADFNGMVTNTGSGATSAGNYQLRVDFRPTTANSILDTNGTPLDGDGDGIAGGDFNFWFRAAAPVGGGAATAPRTIFVDKGFNGASSSTGAPNRPFTNLPDAFALAKEGDIVRVAGARGADRNLGTLGDNPAYEIGNGGPQIGTLGDGATLQIKKGVTLMIDAGAIFKMGGSAIIAGSTPQSGDQSAASLQVLGTPTVPVYFTSYFDQSKGIDNDPLPTVPKAGDWGGLLMRTDVDRAQGRRIHENEGTFLNYIGFADIQYGGGVIGQGAQTQTVNAISMTESRPTLLHNNLQNNADAAMAADPNSFEETTFSEPRYHLTGEYFLDYGRVGPVIRGNRFENNSLNALSIRIDTLAGSQLKPLSVAGRLDDKEVTYVLGQNLIIQGQAGGNLVETVRPIVNLVTFQNATGGTLTAGDTFTYRMTYVDRSGGESLPSLASNVATVGGGGAIQLNNLPVATGDFVSRRLWRSQPGGVGPFVMVTELNKDITNYRDTGTSISGTSLDTTLTIKQRGRLDASLVIDPGIVLKSLGSRIELGIGATMIAEGTASEPIIFTSRLDDRYGAGTTFDSNNDDNQTTSSAGDWGGIVARHLSTLSVDHSLITFGGGNTSIAGGFASFNALELHQATARVSHTTFESNANGTNNPGATNRDSRGPNDSAVIYVVGSQPVLVNNIIRNNNQIDTAAISINANALNAEGQADLGRSTGLSDRYMGALGNRGPLIRDNKLSSNGINGLRVRGEMLSTESMWDDTDMVHVLESQIVIPNFTTYGGLLLKSNVSESLVVKLRGDAGFRAAGLPLDIPDRIGGSLQIVGSPGFPVYLTSLSDDSIGAGFDINGNSQVDTDGSGPSNGSPGDWAGVVLDATSNDRNVDTAFELEADRIQDNGVNDIPSRAQDLGVLASTLRGGDENLRLGVTVHGTIAAPSDIDVYRFDATAGTTVWVDIDRTSGSLDTVVELIDEASFIRALSDNSFSETSSTAFTDPVAEPNLRVMAMDSDSFAKRNALLASKQIDFQSVNPLDAGFRMILPGVAGSSNSYYLRVRSSNLAPGDLPAKLTDLNQVRGGLTTGSYRMQVRLQQTDEIGGSTIRYADIRYAVNGVQLIGLPGHSPLLGESSERINDNGNEGAPASENVGNLTNSDRAELSLAGSLLNNGDVDWYRFTVNRDSIQNPNSSVISTVLDIDYADGGRPDTTLWVYRQTPAGLELVLIGTDSDIADDQAAPTRGNDESDLSRGSFGTRDPFVGASELPDGVYFVAVSNTTTADEQMSQYTSAGTSSPNFRLEPMIGFQRYSEDHFDAVDAETNRGAKAVSFSGRQNAVPFTLADVTLYVAQTTPGNPNASKIWYANAKTGAAEADVSGGNSFTAVVDMAVAPDGSTVGFERLSSQGTDAASGTFIRLDSQDTGDILPGFTGVGSGLTTNNLVPGAPPTVEVSDVGMLFQALTFMNRLGNTTDGPGLMAVASRGGSTDGQETYPSFSATRDKASNVLYRIDTTSLQAISVEGIPDYTGNDAASDWGGTQIVPYGWFDAIGSVTGLAESFITQDNPNEPPVDIPAIYAVTTRGELLELETAGWAQQWGVSTAIRNDGNPLRDPVTNARINFTGLTSGPRNIDGSKYENILFGVSALGRLYAFDTNGVFQPIFPNGATFMDLAPELAGPDNDNAFLPRIAGIDFSTWDVNPWHVSNSRGNDAGHGQVGTFDGSRTQAGGGNSLYFGVDGSYYAGAGEWGGSFQVPAINDSYAIPGGVSGAIESDRIDLRGYSADDLPTLYFNYFLDTETSNSATNDATIMRDSFRVYGSKSDGTWVLLGTNNSLNDNDFLNGTNEFDNAGTTSLTNYQDDFGRTYKPQEFFDSGEAGYTGAFRQARISLAPFAGQDNVRLRFEFSTQGDMRSGDRERGGVEITAVDPTTLSDGDTFVVARTAPNALGVDVTTQTTFEVDLGLVLNMPGGANIPNNSIIRVQNRAFNFRQTATGALREVVYNANMTPAQIAAAFRAALEADGFTVFTNSVSRNILNVKSIVTAGGIHSVSAGLDPSIIAARPGVTAGRVRVDINQEYPIDNSDPLNPFRSKDLAILGVRNAIRTSLASAFNDAGQANNLDVWDVYDNSVQLFKYYTIPNLGPFGGLSTARRGDAFESEGFASRDQRAQNNAFGGVWVDDIVIGFAERGEMASGYNATATPAQVGNNLFLSGGLPAGGQVTPGLRVQPTLTGAYQLNIRTAADFGAGGAGSFDISPSGRTFDTNDRLATQNSIVIAAGGSIRDGDTFTLSDGKNTTTYEFDVLTSTADARSGVAIGNIRVLINANATPAQIATAMSNAINSDPSKAQIQVTSSVRTLDPTSNANASPVVANAPFAALRAIVDLHGVGGAASADVFGSLTFSTNLASVLSFQRFGNDTGFGEDLGDANRLRDQGQVIVSSTVVRDSQGFGIVADAGDRFRADLTSPSSNLSGPRPYPGSPRNLPTVNSSGFAPGVVLVNNIVANNRGGGILVSGDTVPGESRAPATIARILNNTIFGFERTGNGIRVEEGASPTIQNNILANNSTGISVAGLSVSTEVGANLYKGNGTNTVGVANQNFAIVLTASEPLFVSDTNGRFIPAAGSKAIDSSIASLDERTGLSEVKNSVFLPTSPMIAPGRDIGGLLRIDDPLVNTPAGQGQTVFIDRGAVDRADARGPIAVLQNPLDNDIGLVDSDRNNTYVRLTDGNLSYFSIILNEDQGTGPDSATVLEPTVLLTENGRRLIAGVDYVFAYSVNSREIRLTPMSGFWRRDSVYEITLNNQPSFRWDAVSGDQVADGDRFSVRPNDGSTVTFEFESGFVLSVPQTYTLEVPADGSGPTGILDGHQFRIRNGALDVDFEFDTDGTVSANARVIAIPPIASATAIRDIILATLMNPANADLDLAPKAIGTDKISLGTLSNHRVAITSAALNLLGGSDGIEDGQRFVVTLSGKPTRTFEFNLNGNAQVSPGATVITIERSDNYDDIAAKIAAVLNPVFTGGFTNVSAIQGGIVHVGGKVGDVIDVSNSRLSQSGTPGVDGPLELTIPAVGGSAIADGAQFSIRIGTTNVLFEFTKDLVSTPGTRPISIRNNDNGTVIASKIRDSINTSPLGLVSSSTTNRITLNEPLGTVVNVLTSGITTTGTPGGAVPVFFIPSPMFNRTMMSGEVTRALNSIGLGVRAQQVGEAVLAEGLSAWLGSGATSIVGIADNAGNLLQSNRSQARTQFTIVMPEMVFDYGDASGVNVDTLQSENGSRHAILPEDEPLLVLGAYVDADADGNPSAAADGDDTDSQVIAGTFPFTIGNRGPAVLTMPVPSAALVGRSIVVTDVTQRSETFEFTNGGAVTISGAHAVNINGLATASQLASAFAGVLFSRVMAGDLNDLVPIATGALVNFGGTSQHRVDLSNAGTVTRQARGTLDLQLSGNIASYADGNSFAIEDGNGNTVTFELQDTSTATPTVVNSIPVPVDLTTATPASIAAALASAIQSQIDARRLMMPKVTLSGLTLTIANDDEDGVVFDGPFNGRAIPVPMIVTSTGVGMIDAWFDWNQDGDFLDSNERAVASYPVRAGQNTILVKTPANAAIGFTMARVRLSAGGGLETTGVGLGGEVEDYVIEVLDGTPPVSVNDTYTVVEDQVLTRNAATGVLINDSDADGGVFTVFDTNPVTPQIDVIALPEHGTLVINADGSFVYDSDLDYFGTDSFVYSVTDGRLRSQPSTVFITVTPDNDAPTGVDDTIPLQEDVPIINMAGSNFWTNDSRGPLNENGQILTLVGARIITPRGNGESVTVNNDRLSYTPPRDYNNNISGPVLLELTIRDSGVAGGDANPLETKSTLTINISPVNDVPQFTLSQTQVTRFEDNESLTGLPVTTIPQFANPVLAGNTTSTDELLSQTLTFEVVSVSNPSIFTTQPSLASNGTLSFVTAPHQNGTSVVVIQLRDSGLGAPAPNVNLSARQTFTITLTPVNDRPEFVVPANINSTEDQGIVVIPNFATGMVPGPSQATDEANQTFNVIVNAVDSNQFSTQPLISADGTLRFATATDVNGPVRVRVRLVDSGPSSPAPNLNESIEQTFTINVAPINDAPSFAINNRQIDIIEDQEAFSNVPRMTFPNFVTNIKMGPDSAVDETSQTPTFLVSTTAPELFSEQPAIDANGQLTFRTAANKNGRATVFVQLRDSGLGAPIPNVNLSVTQTVTITVAAINDEPSFVIPATANSNEDQGLVSIPNFVSSVQRGPASADDETGQEVTFDVVAVDPSAFSVQPTISQQGTLTFRTAENINSNSGLNLAIRVKMRDNGASAPAPNDNESIERTFVLNVAPVNDPPNPAPNFTATVNEDGSVTFTNLQVLVGATPGPADESGQSLRIISSELTSNNGGRIDVVNSGAAGITSFTFHPAQNRAGQDFFRYVLEDNGNPARSSTGTIFVTVNAINDKPQFTPGPTAVFGTEDVEQTGFAWASNILAGPPDAVDENTGPTAQTLTFVLSVNRPELFQVLPSIDASGLLRYVPAPNASGSAIVTVFLRDSGSGVAPNENRSDSVTFTISLDPVNDAPEYTTGGNVTVDEDTVYPATSWATGIRPGPANAIDEAGQTVTFDVSVDNPGMFAVLPTISPNGQLSFTPAQDAFGQVIVTVVARDNGLSFSPNVNEAQPNFFTITIRNLNDAPTGTPDSYETSEDALLTLSAPGVLSNDSDIDQQTISVVNGSTVSALGVPVTINGDGSFSYDPRNVAVMQRLSDGQVLTDSFTYRATDGVATSNVITVFVTVQGSNDAPVANDDDLSVSPGQLSVLDVLANDTDVDTLIDVRTIQIGQSPLNGSIRVLNTGRIEYTSTVGFVGEDIFTYSVRDIFGAQSREATVRIRTNNAPVAANDTATTVLTAPVTIDVLRNDSDSDGTLNPATVQIFVPPTAGTAEVQSNGTIIYTPDANSPIRTVTFSYAVKDNNDRFSNVAVVTVGITGSLYQNPRNNLDVNNSGTVSPVDALIILNDLNARGARVLPDDAFVPPPFIDVDGNRRVEPRDVLIVLNFLNGVEGEGEGTDYVMMVTPEQMIETVGPMVVQEVRQAIRDSLWTLSQQDMLGKVAMVPAMVHYEGGRLAHADQTENGMELVLESLGWGEEETESERASLFADLDEWM